MTARMEMFLVVDGSVARMQGPRMHGLQQTSPCGSNEQKPPAITTSKEISSTQYGFCCAPDLAEREPRAENFLLINADQCVRHKNFSECCLLAELRLVLIFNLRSP